MENVRAEYDRLLEAGPIIDDGIIAQFNKKFNNYDVAVPSICNGLDKCVIYKIDKNIKMNEREFEDGIEDIIDKQEKEINKELDKRMETLIIQNKSEKGSNKFEKMNLTNLMKILINPKTMI